MIRRQGGTRSVGSRASAQRRRPSRPTSARWPTAAAASTSRPPRSRWGSTSPTVVAGDREQSPPVDVRLLPLSRRGLHRAGPREARAPGDHGRRSGTLLRAAREERQAAGDRRALAAVGPSHPRHGAARAHRCGALEARPVQRRARRADPEGHTDRDEDLEPGAARGVPRSCARRSSLRRVALAVHDWAAARGAARAHVGGARPRRGIAASHQDTRVGRLAHPAE